MYKCVSYDISQTDMKHISDLFLLPFLLLSDLTDLENGERVRVTCNKGPEAGIETAAVKWHVLEPLGYQSAPPVEDSIKGIWLMQAIWSTPPPLKKKKKLNRFKAVVLTALSPVFPERMALALALVRGKFFR